MRTLLRTVTILLLLLLVVSRVSAQTAEQNEKTIQELKDKISSLQTEQNTLSKQITLLDSQIKLTELQIGSTEKKIDVLENEIGELAGEISRLEDLKTKRLELVLHRIPQSYKRASSSQFGWLLFSDNFSELLTRAKYLVQVQEEDTTLYKQLQLTQMNYNERRDVREAKKLEQETLRKTLEKHTKDLATQKKQKQGLLDQTKSSEVVYQRLLAQALAEKQALERALVDSVKVGPVKKGDPIALVGNTGFPGCSTGAHLHFEVRQGSSWVDPSSYLSNKTVKDEQGGGDWTVGSGSWNWPLSDTIRLTQHFGKTPWSWRYGYSGGIHTGFDMISTGSEVIRAPADGDLYSSSQSCGTSSVIKIKYIEHGGGLISFYLHVQ
ncbi:peptidoglycan DD-metalloendopeptidase family protein [Candidatus Gottesmanbacteria bacterium]|nr:peptidoglycan DD-metalloendopeptidase family protein [Candidatus Gottesmanbacteria bacterium]